MNIFGKNWEETKGQLANTVSLRKWPYELSYVITTVFITESRWLRYVGYNLQSSGGAAKQKKPDSSEADKSGKTARVCTTVSVLVRKMLKSTVHDLRLSLLNSFDSKNCRNLSACYFILRTRDLLPLLLLIRPISFRASVGLSITCSLYDHFETTI